MNTLRDSWILFVCFLFYIRFSGCAQDYYTEAAQIKARIMNSTVYDKTVPPRGDKSKPIPVHSFITPELISHVGLAEESLEMTVFFCGSWTDERLSWKSLSGADAIGSFIIVPVKDIWWPGFTLVNTYSEDLRLDRNDAAIVVKDGTVRWCTITTAEVPCTMDMTRFPYDAHDCTLKFATLSYTDEDLSFTTELVSQVAQGASSQWSVQNVSFTTGKVVNQTSLDLSLRLQRTGGIYKYIVSLHTAALTLATVAVFWMPPSSDGRVTLSCLNLGVAMVMLMWLEWWIGASTAVPRIITILGGTMLAQAAIIAISVLVVNMTSSWMPFAPPGSLVHFLRGPVATFLCLSRSVAVSSSDGILQDEEQDRQGSPLKEDLHKQQDWYLVAQGLDRLFFVIFAAALIAVQVN